MTFHNLGLLVIDEEQRFGVGHKERLKSISTGVDVLTLSATPIPRTLQASLNGFRDITLMKTPPPGRKPVETHVDTISNTALIKNVIQREKARGGQVFFVIPKILQTQNITVLLNELGIDEDDIIEANSRVPNLENNIQRFLNKEVKIIALR